MRKIGVALIAFLIVIILFHVTIYVVNNHIAKTLERKLLSCQLPPNSILIDTASVAGKMMGNGNGMQWFGIILIKSDMSEDMLSEWYNSHVDIEDTDMIYVFKQETPAVFEYGNHYFSNFPNEDDCYQIQLFRSSAVGAESSVWESLLNSDLRGH